MYRVFNMDIGFCVIVSAQEVGKVLELCARHDTPAQVIGTASESCPGEVHILAKRLVGRNRRFFRR